MNNIDFTTESDDIAEVVSEEMESAWQEYLETIDSNILDAVKQQIITLVKQLRANVIWFENQYNKSKLTKGEKPDLYEAKLEAKIDLIYKIFFELQNAINLYEGQQVKITYIQKNENGERKILLFDNNIDALQVQKAKYGQYEFSKIGYVLPEHYQILKNTLPDTTNQNLQDTTKEVERRYQEQKRIVHWVTRGNKWAGYKFTNRGPINEAFAQFFLHTQPGIDYFRHDIERNVQTFVMHESYGARRADSLNGFLVGDASKGNIQYAVKGQYGSPQGYKEVLKLLDRIDDTTTHSDLKQILKDFRQITQDKARPLIKKASEEALQKIMKKLQKTNHK